jgi:hypothetical protein
MARRCFLPLFVSCLIVMASCGKKGPIEPPLVRVPQAVENLALIQRGSTIWLTWANPSAYVDGNPLGELTEVEIWMFKEDRGAGGVAKKWTSREFESKAELHTRIGRDRFASLQRTGAKPEAQLTYGYALAGEDIGRKILTFSLRVRDLKKRASGFAAPVSLEALTPPVPPQKVQAVVFEDHIQVSWESPEQAQKEATLPKAEGYNVYRSDGGNAASRLNAAPLKKSEFRDKDFSLGQAYRYFVRAVLEATPPVESDDSETAEVIAKDIFPPAPPSGLTAISGPGFIALSWEAGRESDLAGYRVWRRVVGQDDFLLVASLPETDSSFSDSKVEKSQRYEYAITALDSAGNESRKSAAVPGIVKDESPE